MKRVRRNRIPVVTACLLMLASLLPATVAQAAAGKTAPLVKVKQIGNPTWTVVDLHVFAAPIGTVSDGYAEFGTTLATILPPPHYQSNACLGIGPGAPEPPPYNRDVARGVKNAGYPEGHLF